VFRMAKGSLLIFAAFGAFGFQTVPVHASSECQFGTSPFVISSDQTQTHLRWDINVQEVFWADDSPVSGALADYRNWALSVARTTSQSELIDIQRKSFVGYPNMQRRFDLVISGQAGAIERATCLENLLIAEHTARFPLKQYPSEFMAFVLRDATYGSRLRIYFSSGDGKSTNYGPPVSIEILSAVERDIEQGWIVLFHLHNHPFMLNALPDFLGGTVVPSDGDLQAYELWSQIYFLREARITNGFSTIRIADTDLKMLESTVPGVSSVAGQGSRF